MKKIKKLLISIYGKEIGIATFKELKSIMKSVKNDLKAPVKVKKNVLPLNEKDSFLITYGDQFQGGGKTPLQNLKSFADSRLKGAVSGVHILPFFPYSSDDGFSIIDYRAVNEDFGSWNDLSSIGENFKLAADLVLNHCSVRSEWFKGFLEGDSVLSNYFVTADPNEDLSMIARPRTHPLLTSFKTKNGTKHVWTTFSADQVDLNFENPEILLEMINILLFYIQCGIQVIRLDAIAYLWKEIGHSSIHHPKTHAVVKLFRSIFSKIAPWVLILTETNVPHEENISYFGDGDEAQMVYQFSLPPLVLDAFLRENVGHLRTWAANLPQVKDNVTFFNFLASHDGIGLLPAHGILSDDEINNVAEKVKERGGLVSYKATPKGEIPYELNINYRDAIAEKSLPDKEKVAKFIASQAIMLSLPGVPGIYVHSILGSENYSAGVKKTGMNRTINREKLDYEKLEKELSDPESFRSMVFKSYKQLLKIRSENAAFHPCAKLKVLDSDNSVFAFIRTSQDHVEKILCLNNISSEEQEVKIKKKYFRDDFLFNLINNRRTHVLDSKNHKKIKMEPWEVLWIRI